MPTIVGEAAALSWTPTEGSGTTATLAVVLPDGTTLSPAPTVTHTTGTFTASVAPSQAGRHLLTWSRGTARLVDVLDVWPADPRYLVSVDDAAAAVGQGVALPQARRDEVQLHVAAASAVVEDITGPIVKTSRTVLRDGGRLVVVLPSVDVSVASVTVDGTVLDEDAYLVDDEAGLIYATSGVFGGGRLAVSVAYTVGGNVVPAQVRLACMEQVKFLWQVHRQGARREDLGYTPSGFAVPRMVLELCESATSKAPGFA